MGWQQMRERAKQYQQQTDGALANDILLDTLFSKSPVVRRQSYECLPDPSSSPPDVGTEVRIIDMNDRIDIYAKNQPIGEVDPTQAELMREQQRFAERKGRSVRGRVAKVSKLNNGFSVDVTDHVTSVLRQLGGHACFPVCDLRHGHGHGALRLLLGWWRKGDPVVALERDAGQE